MHPGRKGDSTSCDESKGGLRSLLREITALLRGQRDGLKEVVWIIRRIDCWVRLA